MAVKKVSSIMVLGPSRWSDPRYARGDPPAWLLHGRQNSIEVAPEPGASSPLELRFALVEWLENFGYQATAMELHDKKRGETNIGLFKRILNEDHVDRFFVFWPPDASRHGLDWELGRLSAELAEGQDYDVRLFVHEHAGGIVRGRFRSLEKGRRTRYYEDLIALGASFVPWAHLDELFTAFLHHASDS